MSRPRARSLNSARAVRKMIGMSLVVPSSSRRWATCHPSSPGIITSRRTTSGFSFRATSRPLGPSPASSTSIFSASRLTRQSSRIGGSSSMTKTRVIAGSESVPHTRRAAESCGGGKLEDEARSFSLGGRHPDPPAHRPNEPLGDEEPEARTAALVAVAGAVELPKDPLLLGVGDPDALIDDAHFDLVAPAARRNCHRAAVGRILDGVLDEDRADLTELVRVGLRGERLVGD